VKNLAILQARMCSSRLPGKALMQVNGRPMIEWQIMRILQSKVEGLVLVTSGDRSDDELAKTVNALGVEVFRGSSMDVHSRFFQVIKAKKPKYFIRLTGDCPLIMPDLLNQMLTLFETKKYDCLSNTNPPTYPDGLDIEIISSKVFLEFSKLELTGEEKEHVTLGLWRRSNQLEIGNLLNSEDLSEMRWTVDYQEDFNFVSQVYKFFAGRETQFNMSDILSALESENIRQNLTPHIYRNIALSKEVDYE
jgi:spore coat polysaccharide biosynthesis protein SpsF (cytidylyltransferase family)